MGPKLGLSSETQDYPPSRLVPPFATRSRDSRICERSPAQDWAVPKPQFKNSRGPVPTSGTRRRLRGATARLAQRRGRGPGAQQSAPRTPRGNRWAGSGGKFKHRTSGVYAGCDLAPGLSESPPAKVPRAEQEFPTRGDSVSATLDRAPRLQTGPLGTRRETERWKIPLRERCDVMSKNERSHCPSQTVKKLLEEQRRRQQQPDAGGPPGQFLAPLVQSLTPSANESDAGHSHFLTHQETVSSGLGGLATPTGLPDWDPNTHAAYTNSPYSYPASAAEGLVTSNFYPPSDPRQLCPFPQGMEAESWRVSGLLSGPSQLPPVVQGPSLEAARAHMLALGPQQLLAQDEEGDTLLHLFAARGLRWAAYAAAEVIQAYRHLDIREHKGKTPLLVAAAANQPLIVEDLLNLGAEPNITDHQGRSVLHVAATYGLPGVLLAVFNSGVRVNLEARDFEGLTPLHTAILSLNIAMHQPELCPRGLSTQAQDRLTCVQMLLHNGADHTSQEIKSNKTVLHLAVQAANLTLVQLLLKLPQRDMRTFVNMKAHGNTALHMAAALPPGPPQEAIVRHLLAAGADPTLRNLENEQPIHLLRPGPGPEGLRQLLKRSRVAAPALSS
ncbi:PREDICTED: NF-kappa-B inhibitor delta [Chrysochloris asiatica]|uniref:NF-kappa-B inhibitor delta n=1 Tax=Chrysochloris asiatica TaxID=185453 RepID=A0A9B0TTI2_CHRAS|nr:PREDICTED: NF-kappa-B inhibitor delta [Chrysochloris asiatica]